MGLGELAGLPLGKIPWIKEWMWLEYVIFPNPSNPVRSLPE
jgi:hypothetical protein